MSLFEFNRAAERVEQIADELRDISRQTFNQLDAERDARNRLSHVLFNGGNNSQDQRIISAEV
ncbi:hypothetical protein, partial [Microbacterium sp.]|uniref:hypothetical protein n=1 Tax=Microbacterium sp. TaxID=51671 RepID=UPI003C73DBCC